VFDFDFKELCGFMFLLQLLTFDFQLKTAKPSLFKCQFYFFLDIKCFYF